jgi:Subtilase family
VVTLENSACASRPARSSRRTRFSAALCALAIVGAWSLASAAPASADEISAGEWGRDFIHAAQADKITNGSGVTVGLLDSGVMTQRVNLAGQVTNGPDYAGGVEQPGQSGWGEHGTCMASIIDGTGAGGADMYGVAPGAHILAVRVIRDDDAPDVGGATTSATPISDGIHYAVDHGVQVISMSIGGDAQGTDGDSSDEADAIRYALDHNVAVVIAAGNSGDEGDAISFPGADRGAITVAAVNSSGHLADFSTTGWDVDVAAPGVNITCDAPDSDDEMEIGDGTSQATAFTAGVVALIKAENKNLSPAQIRGILEQSAQDKPAGGRDDQIGFGIIDAQAAVALAAKTKAVPENPATNAQVSGGYFGYGPTQVVAEQAPPFGALARAIAGGAAILLAGLVLAFAMLRRAKRQPTEAMAGPPTTIGEVFVSGAAVESLPGTFGGGADGSGIGAGGGGAGPTLWVAPGGMTRMPEPERGPESESEPESAPSAEPSGPPEAFHTGDPAASDPTADTQVTAVSESVSDAVPSWVRDRTQMLETARSAAESAESTQSAQSAEEPTALPAAQPITESAPGPALWQPPASPDPETARGPWTGQDAAPPTPPAAPGTTLDG